MKKEQIQVGKVYAAKVSGAVVPVRIKEEQWRGDKHVGWVGTNVRTGKTVRIKSAQRLRNEVGPTPPTPPDDGQAPAPGAHGTPGADAAQTPTSAKGAKGGGKPNASLKAVAAADQQNARMRDERAASPDGMTASERAMALSAGSKKKPAKPAKAAKEPKAPKPAKPKRVSAIDAAARVLAEAGKPMKAKEMIEAMEAKGLWKSPGGKTPEATLYAAIIREISARKKESRFRKTERGTFEATAHAAAPGKGE